MSCRGGRLCFRLCSASSASLVHVRAMSLRMVCTRGFGVPSVNFSHSAARILQSSGFNTGIPSQNGGGEANPDGPPSSLRRESENPFAAPPPGFDHG